MTTKKWKGGRRWLERAEGEPQVVAQRTAVERKGRGKGAMREYGMAGGLKWRADEFSKSTEEEVLVDV